MKYLKKFNETYEPKEESVWEISFKSTVVNSEGLTNDQIEKAIFSIKDRKYSCVIY